MTNQVSDKHLASAIAWLEGKDLPDDIFTHRGHIATLLRELQERRAHEPTGKLDIGIRCHCGALRTPGKSCPACEPAQPLIGGTPIAEYIAELERDPVMKAKLDEVRARQRANAEGSAVKSSGEHLEKALRSSLDDLRAKGGFMAEVQRQQRELRACTDCGGGIDAHGKIQHKAGCSVEWLPEKLAEPNDMHEAEMLVAEALAGQPVRLNPEWVQRAIAFVNRRRAPEKSAVPRLCPTAHADLKNRQWPFTKALVQCNDCGQFVDLAGPPPPNRNER